MTLLEETRFILKKYNISANKSLGQNFLINEEIIDTAIKVANITKEDLVIEIGPGLGTLTKPLLEKAGKVISIELDNKMIKILQDRFKNYDNFEIINKDILKVDLKKLIELNDFRNVKIVANLPYYITTPIIMKLLEERLNITSITVMIQKEVADRLVATPGKRDSGAITYTINYYTNPEKVINVPFNCFVPVPKVDSSIIKLNVLKKPSIKVNNENLLFKIIKLSFMQRRKTLVNSLSNSNVFGDKKIITEMMEDLKLDMKVRAEKLTLEQFARNGGLS